MSPYSFDPHLFDDLEQERLEALSWRKKAWVVGLPIVAVVSIIAISFFGPPGLIAALVGAGLTYMIAEFKLFELKERMKTDILGHMADARGWRFNADGPPSGTTKTYRSLGLFPRHDELNVEDHFEGDFSGVGFDLFEALAKVRRKRGKSETVETVFSGLLARFNFPKSFQGSTVVLTDAGFFNWAKDFTQKGERVALEDPVFEKTFQVYSNDQVEARYLLTPTFMQRLLDIRDVFPKSKIQAAFHETYLYLSIDAKGSGASELGFFDVKDLSQPISQQSSIQLFEKELQIFEDIVDGLNLDTSTKV